MKRRKYKALRRELRHEMETLRTDVQEEFQVMVRRVEQHVHDVIEGVVGTLSIDSAQLSCYSSMFKAFPRIERELSSLQTQVMILKRFLNE